MDRLKKLWAIAILIAVCYQTSSAQDGHYSQATNTYQYTNPAAIVTEQNDYTLGLYHRRQWASVATPYVTNTVFATKNFKPWAAGVQVNSNKTDELGFKTVGFSAMAAYNVPINDQQNLALGSQLGFIQKSINFDGQTFDSQYSNQNGFDPNAPTNEFNDRRSISLVDLNWGAWWTLTKTDLELEAGLAMLHSLEPNQSFASGQEEPLPQKYIAVGKAKIPAAHNIALIPHFLWGRQGHATETLIGANAQFELQKGYVEAGLAHRLEDAVILYTGFNPGKLNIGLSYDFNTSSLSEASNGNGAFELTLKWGITSKKKPKDDPIDDVVALYSPELSDKDKDGILDIEDVCPDTYGILKFDGCPAPDTDKDGIFDDEDKCPEEKGPAWNDGCPPLDSDRDGIADEIDQCPSVKGVLAYAGCPHGTEGVVSPAMKKESNENADYLNRIIVHFDKDSYLIKTKYKRKLQDFIFQIYDRPITKILVLGHTDADGSNSYNETLGKNRANAVQGFMIKHRVDPNKILQMSYGEYKPTDTNAHEVGKAKNRRVEIFIF